MRGVEQRLKQRMDTYLDDEESYFAVLKGYLAQGVRLIERERLVAQVNARDLKRLIESWDDFAAATAAADKTVVLSREPLETVGGMLIRSEDGRIRVDNTFEGRLERLRPQLHQIIVERLMPAAVDRLGV